MKIVLSIAAIFLLLNTSAKAQDNVTSNPFTNNGSLVSPSTNSQAPQPTDKAVVKNENGKTLKVSGDVCDRILKQRLDGANFVGGVDVRGNPVKSADLDENGGNFDFPKDIEFDLTLNVFTAAGRADLAELFPNATHSLGKVKYNIMSGAATFNGKPISSEQGDALQQACTDFMKKQ